jgi:hypothetical protein
MDDVTRLLTSFSSEVIGSRFVVKISVMNNGVNPISYMIAVQDLLESAFTLKYFSNKMDVAHLLKLLKVAAE